MIIVCLLLATAVAAVAAHDYEIKEPRRKTLSTPAPAAVYFNGSAHEFKSPGVYPGLKYTLLDWRENVLLNGVWPKDGEEPLKLPAQKIGYYIIRTSNDEGFKIPDFCFAVIRDPATRPPQRESFFGADAALSWVSAPWCFECSWYDGDSYRLTADLCKWAGIPHIRERLSWNETQRKAGTAPEYGNYLKNAKMCQSKDLTVSGMFHDSPEWSDRIGRLPRNLVAIYQYCRTTAQQFGDAMSDWEFWNEEDLGVFSPEAAWDYAACLKAAYLGFKAGRDDIPATLGAICLEPTSPYAYTLFDNDAAKYSEFANFHTYFPVDGYNGLHDKIRKLLKDIGRPEWEVWFTECGTNLEGNSTGESIIEGVKAHSYEQELIIAEFYPKSQIAHMMNGLAKNYYYIFGHQTEAKGAKDWGIMRRDGTVKLSYAAFSNMTSHLATARLAGEMTLNDKLKAYVFQQQDGSQTLVYWAVSEVDTSHGSRLKVTTDNATEFTLRIPNGNYQATDMAGTPFTVTSIDGEAKLTATRYPSYIDGLHGLAADKKPYPVGKKIRYVPSNDEDLSVIIRVDPDKDDFKVVDRKSAAELNTLKGRMKVQVWNLEETAKEGSLAVSGGSLEGLPDKLSLPPMGFAEFDAVFVPDKSDNFKATLALSGTFNGKHCTKFFMPITQIGQLLQDHKYVPLDSMSAPENWSCNTKADKAVVYFDKNEKAIRFDITWNDYGQTRVFNPVCSLNLPLETLANAYAIEFEVKSAQDRLENDYSESHLEFFDGQSRKQSVECAAPLYTWELRRIVLDGVNDKDGIRKLAINAKPVGREMVFWIRNPKLIVKTDK